MGFWENGEILQFWSLTVITGFIMVYNLSYRGNMSIYISVHGHNSCESKQNIGELVLEELVRASAARRE